jgi:glyoxylase I family protein
VDHLVADTAENWLGRHYAGPVETPVPNNSGARSTRALAMTNGTMNHLALTVRNLAKSEAAFYAPVLGFLGYEKVEDIPETMTLWFNAEAKFAVNLWQARSEIAAQKHERYASGFHHCAFDVDSRADVDRLHRLLRDNEIKVLDAPAEYPQYAPGYYAVYFEDADGLKFEVVHMPAFPV